MNLDKLTRPCIKALVPYSSARSEYSEKALIKLDANESPYGDGLNRYPDPYQVDLKQRIAELKSVSIDNVILGNGSDELIDLIIRSFCEPKIDNIISIKPSYGMYRVSANINDVEYNEVNLNEDFSLNSELILEKVSQNTKVIFLCSPNNPAGNLLEEKEIQKLLNCFNGLVVIDEAYVGFSDSVTWIDSLSRLPQLIVLQTLSKSYSLAGIRLGMAFCSKEIVAILNKVKAPYNVNDLSQKMALKALADTSVQKNNIESILAEKLKVIQELKKIKMVKVVYPSDANFLLVKFIDAKSVYSYLVNNGLIVRDRSAEFNCVNCLRITIGSAKENNKLIELLKNY